MAVGPEDGINPFRLRRNRDPSIGLRGARGHPGDAQHRVSSSGRVPAINSLLLSAPSSSGSSIDHMPGAEILHLPGVRQAVAVGVCTWSVVVNRYTLLVRVCTPSLAATYHSYVAARPVGPRGCRAAAGRHVGVDRDDRESRHAGLHDVIKAELAVGVGLVLVQDGRVGLDPDLVVARRELQDAQPAVAAVRPVLVIGHERVDRIPVEGVLAPALAGHMTAQC